MLIRASRTGVLGLTVTALLTYGGVVEAGLLADNSGGAIPGFTGSQLFDAGFSTFTVKANVDFAVFAPGDFGTAFPGLDPSGGADYVYAYQIENLDTDISKLTVGLDGDEPLGAITFITDPGVTDPTTSSYIGSGPTSAAWDFTVPNAIANGNSSAVLIFTSSAAPEFDNATVAAAFSDMQSLPSPLPEPATLGLMAMGLGLVCVRKHNRA